MIFHVTLTPIPNGKPIIKRFAGIHAGKRKALEYAATLIGSPPCHADVTVYCEESNTMLLECTIFPDRFIESLADTGNVAKTVKRLIAR